MGLDMYVCTLRERPPKEVDFKLEPEDECEGLHSWRKHPNLHGWMEELYYSKGGSEAPFNCATVALTSSDLDNLERAIIEGDLPPTSGFFFGESQDEDAAGDLEFIAKARKAIEDGLFLFYDSWW